MQNKITVTVEYRGEWFKPGQQVYSIAKIAGAPTVDVLPEQGPGPVVKRINDFITEHEAAGLASRVCLIVVPHKKSN